MRAQKKTGHVITNDAVDAFRRMVRHQLEMWDASSDLERILKCEVDSGGIDGLAACFGEPATAERLTAKDLRKWLEDYAGESTEEGE
jgi:hypothetical protein